MKNDDEKRIRKNFAEMVELARKESGENTFVTIGNSRAIMQYIAEHPRIDLGSPLPLITDRDELEGIILQVRQQASSIDIRIVKDDLVVSENGRTARMDVEAEGRGSYFGENSRERRQVSIEWIKQDGDWLVQTIRTRNRL